jgi:PAT family beta-lactamase induction signal transducer AmpG
MHRNKTLRYAMFASLYFTQGTILSYFTALNALFLLSRGLTMTDVGIFAAIALIPFVIKIFLGMLSDRVNLLNLGHRKPYILIGLLVQTLCLIVVPFIDPAKYYWGFVAVAFVLQMGMALYDTCTDGLALDTTPTREQGTIQGFMVGGRAVAVVVTASLVGLLAQYVSWTAVFWTLALFTLIPIPMVLTTREADRKSDDQFDWSAFAAFKQKTVIFLAILGFLFFFIIAGANQLVNPFLQESFGISLSMAGYYTTIWGLGVVLGATFGGRIYRKIGMRNATLGAMFTGFVGVLALAFTGSAAMAWPLVALFGLAYGTQQTVYFALAMKYTVPSIAASMFAILMAVTNIGQGAGMAVSGMLVDATGFRITLVILGILNFLALPLLPKIFGQGGDSTNI